MTNLSLIHDDATNLWIPELVNNNYECPRINYDSVKMPKNSLRICYKWTTIFSCLCKTNVFRGILISRSVRPSIHQCVCPRVHPCVQHLCPKNYSSFCQSAGGGIKSHSLTALGYSGIRHQSFEQLKICYEIQISQEPATIMIQFN